MKKQTTSSNSASLKRAGARLLSDVTAVPSRIHHHVIKPLQTSTGRSYRAARRVMEPMTAPTVGSLATFMAAVFGLDDRKQHTA
ncbi:hypothetical protein [Oleiharenicola lentus]|uniref:hypothetical protein n=1 Tax=Oleiharenicola lentus TaxID=2508720 RepID=UPI003F66925B